MNRQGQGFGVVTYFASVMVFVFVWALGLGSWISTAGAQYVSASGATGIEALLIMNMNLVIFLCLFIAGAGVVAIGGNA